jgi:transposase
MSTDLRLRIVRAVEGGSSIRETARRFAGSRSAAIKLMQRVRATGSAAPDRHGGHRRPLLGPHERTPCRRRHRHSARSKASMTASRAKMSPDYRWSSKTVSAVK